MTELERAAIIRKHAVYYSQKVKELAPQLEETDEGAFDEMDAELPNILLAFEAICAASQKGEPWAEEEAKAVLDWIVPASYYLTVRGRLEALKQILDMAESTGLAKGRMGLATIKFALGELLIWSDNTQALKRYAEAAANLVEELVENLGLVDNPVRFDPESGWTSISDLVQFMDSLIFVCVGNVKAAQIARRLIEYCAEWAFAEWSDGSDLHLDNSLTISSACIRFWDRVLQAIPAGSGGSGLTEHLALSHWANCRHYRAFALETMGVKKKDISLVDEACAERRAYLEVFTLRRLAGGSWHGMTAKHNLKSDAIDLLGLADALLSKGELTRETEGTQLISPAEIEARGILWLALQRLDKRNPLDMAFVLQSTARWGVTSGFARESTQLVGVIDALRKRGGQAEPLRCEIEIWKYIIDRCKGLTGSGFEKLRSDSKGLKTQEIRQLARTILDPDRTRALLEDQWKKGTWVALLKDRYWIDTVGTPSSEL